LIQLKDASLFENFGKRVIKSPKYYFTDVGLLAYLYFFRDSHGVEVDLSYKNGRDLRRTAER